MVCDSVFLMFDKQTLHMFYVTNISVVQYFKDANIYYFTVF